MNQGKSLVLLSLLLAAPPALAAPTDWELVKSSDGIKVERRAVAGSPLKEFRGQGVIDAPIADILAVFSDVDRATEWMDSCNAARVVDDISNREKVVYNRTHAPWPVADRDAVLHNVVTIDDKERRVSIDFTAVDDARVPAQKGIVRMPFVRGHWYLWPPADGKSTRVEYQVHASPGGALPNWIVNYASRDLPHKTVAGLRAQVKRRHYPGFERMLRTRFPEHPFLVVGSTSSPLEL